MTLRESESPSRSARVVLYVEDEANDIFFVKRAFAQLRPDIEVRTAANGLEAMDYLISAWSNREGYPMPRLLILDLVMPFSDGFDLLSWIRRQPAINHIPIVVLSSSERPGDRQRAAALGASHYIAKTPSFKKLPANMTPWLPPVVSGYRRVKPPMPGSGGRTGGF